MPLSTRALVCAIVLTNAALSQQSVTSATVSGRVDDPSGAIVRSATVTARNLERNQTFTATTDSQGRYQFLYLPAGAYDLKAQSPGFQPIIQKLTLTVGSALDVPFTLTLGTTDRVDIQETPTAVETVRSQVAETIAPREIDSLPLNGRNYLDLALLVPGVSRTNTGTPQLFAETSAVPGTGLSIAGQRNLNNSFVIDGLSNNDDAAELAGTFYSQEVIREFQVITTGGIAEFGRATSGIINITTKSGSNDLHGRLYGFFRNEATDARNPLATTKGPLTQTQYGASLGGPVRLNRTFFFSNFEQTQRNASGVITIAPANVVAINQVLARIGYKGPLTTTGEYASGLHTTNYFARVDHKLNDSNQLALRYSLYDITNTNGRGIGGLSAISRGAGLRDTDQTIAWNEVATLSPQALNEVRFQFTRSRLGAPTNDTTGPAIAISGVANIGVATGSPTRRDLHLYELSDSISLQRGAHFLKAGVDFLENRLNIVFPGNIPGSYTFANLAAFQSGTYISYQQAFGAPSQFQSNPNVGLFVQDEWRPLAHLTINAGLRYDLQFLPKPIATDTRDIAPRVGISYAPGDRKTVIRASYGLFFDPVPLRATSNALQRDGSKYQVAVLSFGQTAAPAFPNVLPIFPPGQYISISTIDRHIQNGYAQQAGLQIERELSKSTTLAVGYEHLRGLHIILSRNLNVPTLSAAQATTLNIPNLGRPNSNYGNISQYESAGDSYYNGLTASLHQRAGRFAEFRLSYNYSKSIDDISNFFFSTPQNNSNLRDDRGLSDNDQRHRLTLSGNFHAPSRFGGWDLAPILTYYSPLPFNIQTGTDRNLDTTVNDRPLGVGRNTGAGFDYLALDLRLSRTFHVRERFTIQALAESFNTTNRANYQVPNNIFGAGATPIATFRQPTAAADPREIQFALRLGF